MNTLERTLIEKLGYDNGWEVVANHTKDLVVLSSGRHKAVISIGRGPRTGNYSIELSDWISAKELTRSAPCQAIDGIFLVDGPENLATVLRAPLKIPKWPENEFTLLRN